MEILFAQKTSKKRSRCSQMCLNGDANVKEMQTLKRTRHEEPVGKYETVGKIWDVFSKPSDLSLTNPRLARYLKLKYFAQRKKYMTFNLWIKNYSSFYLNFHLCCSFFLAWEDVFCLALYQQLLIKKSLVPSEFWEFC